MVGKSSLRYGRGREVLSEVWERVGKSFLRYGRGLEALQKGRKESGSPLEVQETLLEVQEGSGGPHKGLGGVGRPFHRSRRVGRLSRQARKGREALPKVREGSGGPPRPSGRLRGFRMPSLRSRRGW